MFITGLLISNFFTSCGPDTEDDKTETRFYLIINNVPEPVKPEQLSILEEGSDSYKTFDYDRYNRSMYYDRKHSRLVIAPENNEVGQVTIKVNEKELRFTGPEDGNWTRFTKITKKGINNSGMCSYLKDTRYFYSFIKPIGNYLVSLVSSTAYALSYEYTCNVSFTNAWQIDL